MREVQKTVVAMGILNLCLVFTVLGEDTTSLIKQLGSWNKDKAKKASDELTAMGAKVVPQLIEALNAGGRRQRRFAARTLRQIGQEAADAIPALSRCLEDSDALTRVYAIEALGKMASQADRVMPVLTKATEDVDRNVREQARVAIARLAEPREYQRHTGSAQVETAADKRRGTPTPNSEEAAQSEPVTPEESGVEKSTASRSEHVPQRESYSGKDILMILVRCGLFACIIAGFFSLLYMYREDSQLDAPESVS